MSRGSTNSRPAQGRGTRSETGCGRCHRGSDRRPGRNAIASFRSTRILDPRAGKSYVEKRQRRYEEAGQPREFFDTPLGVPSGRAAKPLLNVFVRRVGP